MDDLLGGVICLCCKCLEALISIDARCYEELICCLCKLCSHDCVESLASCACNCCCRVTGICLEACINSNTGVMVCPGIGEDCNCNCHCPCRLSCAGVSLVLLAIYFCVVGATCFVAAFRFGKHECGEPLDIHVWVQGIAMFGNAFVLMFLCCRYYTPRSLSLPYASKPVFSRFHLLFGKHISLTLLIGLASLGVWWSLFGYYWLSKAECPPEAQFLLTIDHFVIANEFIFGVGFLVLVYSILALAACDEGSCRFESYKEDCFLCCCGCCLRTPENFDASRRDSARRSRTSYPTTRNECISTSMDVVTACGCIRSDYKRKVGLEEAIVAEEVKEEVREEVREEYPPEPQQPIPTVVIVRRESSSSSSDGEEAGDKTEDRQDLKPLKEE